MGDVAMMMIAEMIADVTTMIVSAEVAGTDLDVVMEIQAAVVEIMVIKIDTLRPKAMVQVLVGITLPGKTIPVELILETLTNFNKYVHYCTSINDFAELTDQCINMYVSIIPSIRTGYFGVFFLIFQILFDLSF